MHQWPLCVTIVLVAVLGSLRSLFADALPAAAGAPPVTADRSVVPLWALCATRTCSALLLGTALLHSITEKELMMIRYRGRVVHLSGRQRLFFFTLWCNIAAFAYFCAAAFESIGVLAGVSVPKAVDEAAQLLWQIACPCSWLVALVVTYVLIPAAKRDDPVVHARMLAWKPQVLHNGYVLVCAAEMCLARPRLADAELSVVVLFGCAYIIFAWCLYSRLRVFMYFFLDPHFWFAPLAYLGLLGTMAAFFELCRFATEHASDHWLVMPAIAIAGLMSCRWR
eukprot:TRINITY_DN60577_c0_g1_i1.p1 TRINITY_DN60577_c0_g1~~TRINITY_DN60577_c0_g1_i1.p1  ORF type:complete len:310 (+),score=72.51 TRINITY_DN60577_c0_g1_i1:89-931(+)